MSYLFLYLAAINIIAFAAMGIDKIGRAHV